MARGVDSAVLLDLLNEVRDEMRRHRALLLEALDQSRMLEETVDTRLLALNQRIGELREELEQTIKCELMLLIGDR
jgi:hypothetical protein